jgi:tripartite-type tricarboxylate transporter receptor subunit TctC
VSLVAIAYDPAKDFAPVSMLGSSPFVLAIHPGVPAQTVQELIALAKAKSWRHPRRKRGR